MKEGRERKRGKRIIDRKGKRKSVTGKGIEKRKGERERNGEKQHHRKERRHRSDTWCPSLLTWSLS